MNTLIPNWKEDLRGLVDGKYKLASAAPPADREAINQAFMEQAYTMIGNRDRLLMKDPYMLGFEVIERNDDGNRLVGSFCYRVGDEILLAPVFYLNGKIKGVDLLYRKGVNRFVANTERWINYLISRSKMDPDGRGAERGQMRAKMHVNLNRMVAYPSLKTASFDSLAGREGFRDMVAEALTKQAAGNDTEHPFFGMLPADGEKPASFLVNFLQKPGMKEACCRMIELHHPFAEEMVLSNALTHIEPVQKRASAAPSLFLRFAPTNEKQASELYKRGFAIEDGRDTSKLRTALATTGLNTAAEAGINTLMGEDGSTVKVLYAPIQESPHGDRPRDDMYYRECANTHGTTYYSVVLEGKDKGCVIQHRGRSPLDRPMFVTDVMIEPGAKELPDGVRKPKVGKAYLILNKNRRTFEELGLVVINTVSSSKGVTRVNMEGKNDEHPSPRLVVRDDLDESEYMDGTLVMGKDAVFVEVKTLQEGFYHNFSRPDFRFVLIGNMEKGLSRMKEASVSIRKMTGDVYRMESTIVPGKSFRLDDMTPPQLAVKLARDLGLSSESVHEIVDLAHEKGSVEFDLMKPGIDKLAYMSLQEEPDWDQPPEGYDPDFGIPVEEIGAQDQVIGSRWDYPFEDEVPHWGDSYQHQNRNPAGESGEGRQLASADPQHIPDAVLTDSSISAAALSEMGRSLGMEQMIDHGAVSSLLKVHDAKAYIGEYVGKLEGSLDYLGRLLFMLYWRPKDFAEMFGQDDLAQMENKLTGNFTQYADLVLDLLQSSKSEIQTEG